VNKWIRNKSDEAAIEEGYYFDEGKANHICEFFENFLKVVNGRMAKEPFIPLTWQRDWMMMLNGWRDKDGNRRFKKAFLALPKKSGKSALTSGLALYFALADGEADPNIVIAATSREQAGIAFDGARDMAIKSTALRKLCRVVDSRKRIDITSGEKGQIKVISSDSDRSEGLNCSCVIYDEAHAAKNRDLFDALLYAGIARKQPLFITISTAGFDRNHFFRDEWDYAKKIIDSNVIDLQTFATIYSAEGKDVDDENVWLETNPSIPEVLSLDDFRASYLEAKQSPTKWASWLRYRLNVWSSADKDWLNMAKWEGCTRGLLPESLHGKTCYGGLDLSHKQDLTAFVLYFPEEKAFLCWSWTTKYQVEMRNQKNKASYLRFIEDGHLIKLDGEVINQDFMLHKICELAKQYKIQTIGYDPWNSQQLALNLEDEGLDMASFRQGYGSLSEPTKLFEEMVLEQSIEHFNNPLLRWTASNCMVTQDPAGNIKPDKDKSHEMIDPILCCIMALGLANISRPTGPSIYETRGVLRF
jgi:phage terminase large subunit-like protein